jgi:coenzyme F420-0:L-glutamate ligase / coenzyme F420-1:gamma-L-glutamate ligase
MTSSSSVQCFVVRGMPVVKEGDDIASLVQDLVDLEDGDILCLASTIVAKSEGRSRDLGDFPPGPKAEEIAKRIGKDPRFVQAVLDQSVDTLVENPFLLVVTKFGHICINAGIDQSNVGSGRILLLPEDPCASAERIRSGLKRDCAVVITDTCGRPFRCGVTGVAVGCSGIAALKDWRGKKDIHGKALEITLESIGDEVASMANVLMGEAGDGTPAVVIRGLNYPRSGGSLFRPESEDVIRRLLKLNG